MGKQHVELSGVPCFSISRVMVNTVFQAHAIQALCETIHIVPELIEHQSMFTVQLFNGLLECFDLTVMDRSNRAIVVINRTVAQLQQFARQHSSRSGLYPFLLGHLQQRLFFKQAVSVLSAFIELDGNYIGDHVGKRQIVL